MKDTGKLMSMLAFIVLIITAVVWAVLFIFAILQNVGIVDGAVNLGWLRLISDILVVAVVVWFAWQYVKGMSTVWKVIFVIGAIIAVLGVFGVHLIPPVKK